MTSMNSPPRGIVARMLRLTLAGTFTIGAFAGSILAAALLHDGHVKLALLLVVLDAGLLAIASFLRGR